jgi:hypothetical protein
LVKRWKKPSLAFSSSEAKNAVFDFLHFQSLMVIENAGPSLVRSESAINQRFLGFFQLGSQKRGFRLPPFSITYGDRKCRTVPGPIGKRNKSALPWLFPARKSKNAVFDFLHFQSLMVIENAGPSLVRSESAINQRFLKELPEKIIL